MNSSQFFIIISITVLAIIVLLVLLLKRNAREKRLTPLAGLVFGFILAGILLGNDGIPGYGLMAFGLILAGVDIVFRLRRK